MTETPNAETGAKAGRILACDRCYRRKIKCNKTSPCSNCLEAGSACVPAATRMSARRRNIPKKQDLFQRLEHYEKLLRQNSIRFGQSSRDISSPNFSSGDAELESVIDQEPSQGESRPLPTEKLNIWQATHIQKGHRCDEDKTAETHGELDLSADNFTDDHTMQRAMDSLHRDYNDHLLFFTPNTFFDLTAQHPPPGEILRLWQVYQDNVDPLLKVTHAPTLQSRITNIIGNPNGISFTLGALLFGIYSVALISLTDVECSTMLASTQSRGGLLNRYQIASQQALLRCGYLRSDDRDCLTALYLYVISIKSSVDRRSLCSFLGSVFRIAQRMELHNEARNAKHSVFEAEMRRRLWWSLVAFDAHVCESSNNLQSANLVPTWDCKLPSNVNDFELRPDMKSRPPVSNKPSQALYIVMRSLISQRLRHSDFQLAFINPILENSGRRNTLNPLSLNRDNLALLEQMSNIHLYSHLDPHNPLHTLTILTSRAQISRAHLLHHYWTHSRSKTTPTNEALDSATCHALHILECEAQLTTQPQLQRFQWHISRFYFPAYVHILKDLRVRPEQPSAERAWDVMSGNFHARAREREERENPVMRLFADLVLDAWDARVKVDADGGLSLPPRAGIVEDVRTFLPAADSGEMTPAVDFDLDYFLPVPMELSDQYVVDEASSHSLLRDLGLDFFGHDLQT